MDKKLIKLGAQIELARRDFFSYCQLKAPDFYKSDRAFLVKLCGEFQDFLNSDETVMIVNLPPRHGKSRTASCFVEWVLGKDHNAKIMTGSYNETLSTMFSKNVRDTISETKADKYKAVYSDVFPGTKIKRGDGAMNLWSLAGGYNNYLATSPTGTATGFGCSLMIVDDLIKNAEEANNEDVKGKHWEWFTNTMLSRLEENGKIIIIMTRWASDDLAGRALEHYTQVRRITMKALADKEKQIMLCPEILSYKSYQAKIKAMGIDIASANYQQEPIDLKGRLYENFKTYSELPPNFNGIYSYTDTADEGSDFPCCIIWGVYQREAYVLDVYYTKASMEITERETAERHKKFIVNNARIESNNGGSGFARNVRRISGEIGNNATIFSWFHQSKNKKARILSNSSWVQNHIYFPFNWRDRFPEYYAAMTKYQREGKNAHDDAPGTNKVRKIHSGLPAVIVDTLAYIVKSDLDKVKTDSDEWEKISQSIDFLDLAGKAVADTLVDGDGAFKISVDTSLSPYPIVEFIGGDMVDFEIKRGIMSAVIFKTVYTVKSRKFVLYERYGRGFIESRLYDSSGNERPLSTVPELADMHRTVHFSGDYIMAVPLKFYDSKKYHGRGKSIFDGGKSDCFDALDEVVSQWIDAVRAGRVRKYIPNDMIPKNPDDGSLKRLNDFGTEFVMVQSPFGDDKSSKIEVIQPDIKYEAFVSAYTNALLMCLQGLVSPATLGIDVGKMSSAEAQREKKDVTGNTRNTITTALEKALPELIEAILKTYDNMQRKAPGNYNTSVSFGEYGASDFDSRVETVGKASTYGIMSVKTQVDELWGSSKDEKWKADEVQRIKSEKGLLEADDPSVGGKP